MSDQVVTELAPGDIQRPAGGAPAGAPPAAAAVTEAQPAAPMSAEQQAVLREADGLKQRLLDPSLSHEQRDALMKYISERQRFAFGNGPDPRPKADPRLSDMREHDPMAESLSDAAKTVTPQEREQIEKLGKIRGLTSEQAGAVSEFAQMAQLDRSTARQLMERAAAHAADGWLFGEPLTQQEIGELTAECVRAFGSVEKAATESALARSYLKHVGLEKFNFGSLTWDPATILALAYRGRVLKGGK